MPFFYLSETKRYKKGFENALQKIDFVSFRKKLQLLVSKSKLEAKYFKPKQISGAPMNPGLHRFQISQLSVQINSLKFGNQDIPGHMPFHLHWPAKFLLPPQLLLLHSNPKPKQFLPQHCALLYSGKAARKFLICWNPPIYHGILRPTSFFKNCEINKSSFQNRL